jgi:hypothetical protein
MVHFRTEIKLRQAPFLIQPNHAFFCIGSCFTEHIYQKLKDHLIPSFSNPGGIVYNPISIADQMNRLLQGHDFTREDLLYHDELYHGIYHHGRFSHTTVEASLTEMNQHMAKARLYLQRSDVMLITFGSALVYQHLEKNQIVANCHRIPADHFEKRFLTPDEVLSYTQSWIEELHSKYPNIQLIFSLSPVRYLKEGFREHTINKAILTLALNEIQRLRPAIHYFPSYEIMMDDLRDYRFYSADGIHPSDLAIQYIWDQFKVSCFHDDTKQMIAEIDKWVKNKKHRPLHPETSASQAHTKKMIEDKSHLAKKYPFLDWSDIE